MSIRPAENLYNEIKKLGISYIDNVVINKISENYYLEFKTCEQGNYLEKRSLSESDRKNFSRAISAFGNSEGGVIIWGIETGKAEADYASIKKPIKKHIKFPQSLRKFCFDFNFSTAFKY